MLDDFSRYIIAWKLSSTMGATDVTGTLDEALAITGVDQMRVQHRPRLLSDNGSAYVSGELREYLGEHRMAHTGGGARQLGQIGNLPPAEVEQLYYQGQEAPARGRARVTG